MYTQDFSPVSDSLGLTAIFAVLPLLTLFVLLGGLKVKAHWAALTSLGVAMVVAMGLASCATYDDDFARVNSRLDTLDTRVQDAAQNAAAANQAAQRANARLDSLEGRVQQLETSPRVPRG